jgi:anti-sigma regulatory factor (Ser/Thr protein kinase)
LGIAFDVPLGEQTKPGDWPSWGPGPGPPEDPADTVLLPVAPTSPALARAALDRALSSYLSSNSLYDSKLMATELVTNSLRHAGLTPDDHVRLAMSVDPTGGVARVEVADSGPGFTPASTEHTATGVGGRGLKIVEELSLRWGVSRDEGSVVWFEVGLQDDAGPGTSGV